MKILLAMCITVLTCPGIAFADNDQLKDKFNKLDENNDSMLTRKELQSKPALTRFSNFYSRGSFDRADVNKDDQIDIREFIAQEQVIPAE